MENEENLKIVRNKFRDKIMNVKSLMGVYMIIRKSYRLTFLSFIKSYLSKEDFAHLLADAWVSSENPNQDTNVSVAKAARWFREADKETLMRSEDYEVFKNLPDKVTAYRGVAVGRNPKGLSWTQNYDKAKWFANRFNEKNKVGYIEMIEVDKSKVLAYFNTRDEDELIIYPRGLQITKIDGK
jgi:hypothetical protein